MKRRDMLKAVALTGAGLSFPEALFGQAAPDPNWRSATLRYLESLARPDHGYAWEDQEQSHLTPTFAVIGCYRALKQPIPNKSVLAEFVRTHHPAALKKLEQERRIFEFQQVQALAWLGEDASPLRERIFSWSQPLAYMKQYEQHGYPLFSSEMGVVLSRALLGSAAKELPGEFSDYLNSRRRPNGSFNNTPASDGSDGHVLSTWWGLQALRVLGRSDANKEKAIAWLRSCQLPNGGFTFSPKPEFGGVDDVAYTWAATRALRLLGTEPANREACVRYVHSLANADGGFADRPGWLSNPMATYYALETLETIGVLDAKTGISFRSSNQRTPTALPKNLKVFSIQLEAHGRGSPVEAVDLARHLRIHFWGAKNAKPEWIKHCQSLADAQNVPLKFFSSDEEYGTWVNVPGLGTYSHTSDIVAPAGKDFGAPLSNKGVVSWPEFRERRWAALEKAEGRLVWQFGENEELVRMYLDDSVERGGYAAISTFHFGNPDFTNSEPFLHRWRGKIPYVALQDSHGPEPWWFSDMTTGFRTLFLATEPTWDGWLAALKKNWVVPVRRDQWTNGKTWMHSSSRAVMDFVRAHERDWRWWDNTEIQRPMVSLVAVKPSDEFEVARPEVGVMLRVRCAWENTPQGLAKKPLAELLSLMVDGKEVSPTLMQKRQGANFADSFHQHHLPNPAPGKHTASAAVRITATNETVRRTLEFVA